MAKKCVLCEQKKGIRNQDNLMRIPFIENGSGLLQILNRTEHKEYVFEIYHCPLCGRKFSSSHTDSCDKECSLCKTSKSISTLTGSPAKGKLMLAKGKLVITKHQAISVNVKNCPMCGIRL